MPTTYQVTDGAIMEMTLQGYLNAQRVMIVRHYWFTLTGGGIDTDGRGALDTFYADCVIDAITGMESNVLAGLSTDFIGAQWVLQWIHPTRYARVIYNPTANAGTGPAPAAPPGVSGAITLQAVTTGRHSRGTVHLPAVPASWCVDGRLNAAGLAAYEGVAQELRPSRDSHDTFLHWKPIIYYRALPALSQDVANSTVRDECRTMRRRVVGRGA